MSSPITCASPIFVTALSGIVLGEHVGWRRWTAILVGFCGVLIAMRPSAQTVSWPAMIALGGSISFAFLMLITRSLRATPDIVLASSQFGGTFLLGALLSPIGWVTPSFGSLGLFAIAGITSVAALLCVNRSLKLAPASVVVPYQYSMIVWAVIFGFVVWGECRPPPPSSAPPSSSARGFISSCASRSSGGRKQRSIRRRNLRHCERSEAIQLFARKVWIASSLRFSQ